MDDDFDLFDEEDEAYARPTTKKTKPTDGSQPRDYAHVYNPLDADIMENESESEEDYWEFDKDKKKKNEDDSGSESDGGGKEPAYVFYDFRHGPTKWPDGVEIVDKDKAAELVEKAKEEAAEAERKQKELEAQKDKTDKDGKDKEKGKDKGKDKKDKKDPRARAAARGDFPRRGSGGANDPWWLVDGGGAAGGAVEEEEVVKDTNAPEGAKYETLNDGSTALLVPPG